MTGPGGAAAQFRLLVAAQVVIALGAQVTVLAVPTLAIVELQATPLTAAGLFAAGYLATAVSGPLAGAAVDRWRPTLLLVWTGVAEAVLLLTVPLAGRAETLTMAHLYAVTVLTGCLSGLGGIAVAVLTRRLTTASAVVSANAALSAGRAVGGIAGPGLAGGLVAWVGPATAMLVDAVAQLAAATLLIRVRGSDRPGAAPAGTDVGPAVGPAPGWRATLAAGFDLLRGHRLLVRVTIAAAALNLGGAGLGALYLIYAYETLRLSPAEVGFTFAAYGLATFTGIAVTPMLDRRFETGRLLRLVAPIAAATLLLIPAASLIPATAHGYLLATLIGYQLVFGCAAAVWAIAVMAVQQREVPTRHLGVVLSLTRTLGIVAIPVGALGAGVLAERVGVLPVLVGAALVALAGTTAAMSGSPRASKAAMVEVAG